MGASIHEQIRQVLSVALAVEKKEHHVYQELAKRLQHQNVKDLFEFLASEEARHASQLLKKITIYGGPLSEEVGSLEKESLAEELEKLISVGDHAQLLAFFINQETARATHYHQAAREAGDPVLSDFFSYLGNDEEDHCNKLKELLEKL